MNNSPNNLLSIVKPLLFKSVRELRNTPKESTGYIVEDLLPRSGLSILAGKPKMGKSTLARQLAVAIAQGKPFLGRRTEKGTVLYMALEEKPSEVCDHFRDLGLTEDDHVLTYCEPAPENACRALEEAIKETEGVQLVIIDPIFRFVRVKDSNDYAMVTKAWEPLLKLARSRGAYILTIHHLKKRESDNPIDDVLGSTAIVAGVDTILVLNSKAGSRTLQSLQRYGSNLEETMLKWNPEKRELSLGVSSDEAELLEAREIIGRIESKIFDYLSLNPDATQEAIFETVTGKTTTKKRAFREMVDSGQIKEAVLAKRGSHLPTPTPGLKRRVCQANNQATHSHNRR